MSHPNHFLSALSPSDFSAVALNLKVASLASGEVLFDAGQRISSVFFPHSGLISLVISLASGETVETGLIGRDSLVGGAAVLDGGASQVRAIVQASGETSVASVDHLRRIAAVSPAFRNLLFRHENVLLAQVQQLAACNVEHRIEQRLARWLLRSRDLLDSDDLPLTQEFIGQMLGVQRTSVSIIAGSLQDAGVIRYRRGHIRILDRQALLDRTCECYNVIKAQSERLFIEKPV